jgi:hypothetical protein
MKNKNLTLSRTVLMSMAAGAMFLATGCSDNRRADINTFETAKAKSAVEAYDSTGTNEMKLKAEKAFADLDKEIKELELRVEATNGGNQAEARYKMNELKKRESELRSDFNEAKFNTLIEDIKNSVR